MTRTHFTFMSIFLTLGPANPMVLAGAAPESALAHIQVSFKLDPRLASGVYGGERWVSPATYVGASGQDTVEVKAVGLDTKGNSVSIIPEWIASDPEMVAVSPSQGEQVKISVKRAGQSSLKVTSNRVTRELTIKAENKGAAMQVEIAPLAEKQAAEAAAKPSALKSDESAGPLKTRKERISYVLGANLGIGIRKQSLEVDPDLVVQGLKDALGDSEMLLTEHEVLVIMTGLQNELRQKQVTLAAEKIVATKELGEENKKQSETFLADNKAKEGVVTLESGLQYKVLKAGDGKKPTADDTVVCHYRGTLLNGTEFDSSYQRDQPATFPLNRVIKGWNQALQLMPVGSKWQLFVPPALAYGERGANGGIGPNATLIFEVELLSIQDKSEAGPATRLLRPTRRQARMTPRASK